MTFISTTDFGLIINQRYTDTDTDIQGHTDRYIDTEIHMLVSRCFWGTGQVPQLILASNCSLLIPHQNMNSGLCCRHRIGLRGGVLAGREGLGGMGWDTLG